jgi:hypothetical protein
MTLEYAVRARDIISNLVEQISDRKLTVWLSKSMVGDTSYSVHLKANEIVYVFKRCNTFFRSYDMWYDGVAIDIPTLEVKRLYNVMQKVYRDQERIKVEGKIANLEKLVVSLGS